jgi:hypothetical protein
VGKGWVYVPGICAGYMDYWKVVLIRPKKFGFHRNDSSQKKSKNQSKNLPWTVSSLRKVIFSLKGFNSLELTVSLLLKK